jgi:hypothetical protein
MFFLVGRYGGRACQGKEDIAKSFREGDKALMVYGGC